MNFTYYDKEFDLNGTVDELLVETRNGYNDNEKAIDKIIEFVNTDRTAHQMPKDESNKWYFMEQYLLARKESLKEDLSFEQQIFLNVKMAVALKELERNYSKLYISESKTELDEEELVGKEISISAEVNLETKVATFVVDNTDFDVNEGRTYQLEYTDKDFFETTSEKFQKDCNEGFFYSIPAPVRNDYLDEKERECLEEDVLEL